MNQLTFKLRSTELNDILLQGKLPGEPGRWVAQCVAGDEVVFAKAPLTHMANIYIWFKAIRAISLTATLMPSIAVLLWLYGQGSDIDLLTFSCAVIGLVLLQISVNLFNDVGDYLKLIDLPSTAGGSGVIQAGWLTALQVRNAAIICLVVGCSLGLPAVYRAPLAVLACGLLAVVGVIGYSGKPFNFKYRAMGDASVFLLCGPILTIGLSFAAVAELVSGVIALGAYFGFAASAILNANNISDIKIDSERGAFTLAAKLGFDAARKLQVLYYVMAYLSLLILLSSTHVVILLPVILIPLVIVQVKKLFQADHSFDPSLSILRFDAAKLHLLMGVLLCVALIFV